MSVFDAIRQYTGKKNLYDVVKDKGAGVANDILTANSWMTPKMAKTQAIKEIHDLWNESAQEEMARVTKIRVFGQKLEYFGLGGVALFAAAKVEQALSGVNPVLVAQDFAHVVGAVRFSAISAVVMGTAVSIYWRRREGDNPGCQVVRVGGFKKIDRHARKSRRVRRLTEKKIEAFRSDVRKGRVRYSLKP